MAAVALALTGPGQTVGVSVFVDPMQDALGLTRAEVSGAYMVGTLLGSLVVPFVGRAMDRLGVRIVMVAVGAAFGLVAMAMAGVAGLVTLTLAFIGIRALGQGSLILAATTAVGVAFHRRRGLAVGSSLAVGTALMGLVPLLLTAAIGGFGWRAAWVIAGAVVVGLVVPLGWFGLRAAPRPSRHKSADGRSEVAGWTRTQALRSPLFWAITGATVSTGLVGTGMMFHQISLLSEQGLTATQAAANFLPQSLATIGATMLAGWLADRATPRAVVTSAMMVLIGAMGMVIADVIVPGLLAITYGVAIGAAGGLARAYEAAATPRFFGTGHLGSIRGVMMAINAASSALGPIALALGHAASGSYGTGLTWLLVLPVGTAGLALVARPPSRADAS